MTNVNARGAGVRGTPLPQAEAPTEPTGETFPWMIEAIYFAEIIGSLQGASGRTQFTAKGSPKMRAFLGKRRSSGMSESCCSQQDEGYGACDDVRCIIAHLSYVKCFQWLLSPILPAAF